MTRTISDIRVSILVPLILISFLLRLRLSTYLVTYPDSTIYLSHAKEILKGRFFFDFVNGVPNVHQPLYPLLTAFLSLFTGNVEQSSIIVSTFFGALVILPVYFLAKSLYGEKAAWLASLLTFFDPLLIYWSSFSLTESLFIFLFMTLITLNWLALQRDRWHLYLLTGMIAGLCYLTRVIGVMTILIPFLWILLSRRIPRENNLPIFISLLLVGAGTAIVMAPHLLYLHSLFGEWRVSGFSPYGGIMDVLTRTYFLPSNLEFLSGQGLVGIILARVFYFTFLWSKIFINIIPVILILVFIGLLKKRWALRFVYREFYILSCTLLYGFILILFAHETFIDDSVRLISPMLPLFFILAARGAVKLSDWIVTATETPLSDRIGLFTRRAFLFLGILFIVLSLSFEFYRMQRYHIYVKVDRLLEKGESAKRLFLRRLISEMKKDLPDRPRIMSRKPYIPYYVDGIWFGTPNESYKKVIAYARSRNIDYLFLDSEVEPYLTPKIAFLMNPKHAPSELELVGYTDRTGKGPQIVLYRIRR